MKKLLLIFCTLGLSVLFTQCGSSKKLQKTESPEVTIEEPKVVQNIVAQNDEIEITIPLSEPEYRSTAEYYRVTQEGVSTSSSMAKKIAIQNARQELATSVKADLRLVIENYGANREVGLNQEVQTKYQELAYTVVSQQLLGVILVGEKLFKMANNNYKYYVCLQMDKNVLEDKVVDAISKDKKLEQDFDLNLFKKVFNEQMDKFENNK